MTPVVLALAAALSAPSAAQDCDARALSEEMIDASPVQVAPLYVKLAECDPAAALKLSGTQLLRVLPGPDGDAAAVAAVDVGATDALLEWMDSMLSKDRSRTIAALGEACDEHAAVKTFLVGAMEQLGDQFWKERWYRSLAHCGGSEVGDILAAELDKGAGSDKTRYFGILETYARSQGAAAIPKLVELAGTVSDVESLTYIVQAMPDTAQVGDSGGADTKTAATASAAIVGLAPSLPPKVIEAARVALQALGDEAAADGLASERFRDLRQEDGGFIWGVVAVETASCKKGSQTWRRVHHAMINEGGQTWPDQLQDKVRVSVETGWELSLGDKCKSEGAVRYRLPSEPFADEAAFEAWREAELSELAKTAVDKTWTIDHDPLGL